MLHTIKHGKLEYLTADALEGSIHCFSTRYGGVSTGDFASLNLGSNRGDPQENVAENYRRVAAFFGVGRDDCAVTKQVHGNEVRVVTGADKHVCGSKTPYEADGLVTTEHGLPIFCFVADCAPVRRGARRHCRGALRLAQLGRGYPRRDGREDVRPRRGAGEHMRRDGRVDRPLLLRDGRRCAGCR